MTCDPSSETEQTEARLHEAAAAYLTERQVHGHDACPACQRARTALAKALAQSPSEGEVARQEWEVWVCPTCGPINDGDLIQGIAPPVSPDDDGYTEDYYCDRGHEPRLAEFTRVARASSTPSDEGEARVAGIVAELQARADDATRFANADRSDPLHKLREARWEAKAEAYRHAVMIAEQRLDPAPLPSDEGSVGRLIGADRNLGWEVGEREQLRRAAQHPSDEQGAPADLIRPGDQLQSAASRMSEWLLGEGKDGRPYEVHMAALEARSAVDAWTAARSAGSAPPGA